MMNIPDIGFALVSLLSLIGIWIWLAWLYPEYATDIFRQRMFALRDRLFDEALEGRIAFTHPAYGMLRSTMNGFIRFAHRISLGQMLWIMMVPSAQPDSRAFTQRWESALSTLDPNTRDHIEQYLQEMNWLVIRHVIRRSPFFFTMAIFPAVLMSMIIRRIKTMAHASLDRIDTVAFTIGKDHQGTMIASA